MLFGAAPGLCGPESRMHRRPSRQAGFTLVEVVVVVVLFKVFISVVLAVLPRVSEKARQTESINNVRNMLDLMIMRKIKKGWQPFNGKNFVLYLVAAGEIDVRDPKNLETFFSPGDVLYTLDKVGVDRYREITLPSLKHGDFHGLTSYAGRRNAERDYLITPDAESQGVPVISDDDDGPLHHRDGLIVGYSNRSVRLMEWEELGIGRPADARDPEPFLGDSAAAENLRALSSN
jgi:hypothetical protein